MLLITSVALAGTLLRVKFPFASVVVPRSPFLINTETPGIALPALSTIRPLTVVSARLFKGLPVNPERPAAEALKENKMKVTGSSRITILSIGRYIGQPLIRVTIYLPFWERTLY